MSNSVSDNIAPVISRSSLKSQQLEIERLRRVCLLYAEYRPLWDFYLSAYEGGPEFTNGGHLYKHPREHAEDFIERAKRVHYLNYCEPLVDFFTAFIFAETIQRNGGSNAAFYQNFIKDVNRKGEDITSFMQQVSDAKQIFGMVYVMVDAPQLPEQAITKAQEQEMGFRPYWIMVRPDEITDWVVDSFDQLQYMKRVQFMDSYIGSSVRRIERYYEWFTDRIEISDIDITLPGKPVLLPKVILANQLGEIPVVILRYKRSIKHKHMGNSFLRDLALNNKEIMNLTSLLQEFLYRQCFNILAMEMDNILPTASQSEGDVSTANILNYPKDGKVPEYIAPSSDPAAFIQGQIQSITGEMYKRAAQDTVNELYNGGKASGFSKSQSFATSIPKIATRADILEKAENKLMVLTMKYLGKTWDGVVKYKDRYELTNISDALGQLGQMFKDLQMPSETFIKEEMKRFVHEFDGKITDDLMTKIYAEIDGMDFEEWQATQKLAYIGAGSSSPEAPEAFGSEPVDTNASKNKVISKKPVRKPSTQAELTAESTKQSTK